MLVNKKNYQSNLQIQAEQNKVLSSRVAKLFENIDGNKPLNISSMGNSISSGYSKCDEMIPLLARTSLYKEGYQDVNFYSYARVRRNEERNVLNWYDVNIEHMEINNLLIADILAKEEQYARFGERELGEYQKFAKRTNLGMQDYVQLDKNIIIYNGLSGSFTDTLRKGNIHDKAKLLSCFKKDYEDLKALLKQFYRDNPHVQVYVCGLPDFMEWGITSLYDKYIRLAVASVPNAIYVPGSSRNFLCRLENQKELDIHYNQVEYLMLLNRVFESIIKNYIKIAFKTDVLSELKEYSQAVEMVCTTSKGESEIVWKIIQMAYEKYGSIAEQYGIDLDTVLDDIWDYYDKHYLSDYGCTDRNTVRHAVKSLTS